MVYFVIVCRCLIRLYAFPEALPSPDISWLPTAFVWFFTCPKNAFFYDIETGNKKQASSTTTSKALK